MYELRCVDGRFFPGIELDAEKRTELEQEFLGTVCENLDNLRELLRVEVFDRPTWTVPESVAKFVGELEDLEEAEPVCTNSVDFSEVSIFHSRHEYLAYQKLLRKIRRGGVAGETDIRSVFTEQTVADYIENLRQRAKEFGVMRNDQAAKAIELFQELSAFITLHDNTDDVERKEQHCNQEDIIEWIREVAIPEFNEIDAKFRETSQKYWIQEI